MAQDKGHGLRGKPVLHPATRVAKKRAAKPFTIRRLNTTDKVIRGANGRALFRIDAKPSLLDPAHLDSGWGWVHKPTFVRRVRGVGSRECYYLFGNGAVRTASGLKKFEITHHTLDTRHLDTGRNWLRSSLGDQQVAEGLVVRDVGHRGGAVGWVIPKASR
jgi:hypothetical protein